jgi:hypothetical protein
VENGRARHKDPSARGNDARGIAEIDTAIDFDGRS